MPNTGLPPVPQLTKEGFKDPVWPRWLDLLRKNVISSLTSLTIESANGFDGNVTTDSVGNVEVTLSTTVSGVLKGSGGALTAAVAGTDYVQTISATLPLSQSGGAAPNISMTQAGAGSNGWLSSTDWTNFNNKISGNQNITLSGDATGSGTTAIPVTLSTVNSNVGTFGNATNVGQFTVDGKGRITSAASVLITPAFSSITGKPTTATGYGITSIDGIPIGSTTPSTAVFTSVTINNVIGATLFKSISNTITGVASGVATTIITLPNTGSPHAFYIVSVGLSTVSNDATNYGAWALIATDGTSARILTQNNAPLQTITLSGLNVQTTQTSGGAQTVNGNATRIG